MLLFVLLLMSNINCINFIMLLLSIYSISLLLFSCFLYVLYNLLLKVDFFIYDLFLFRFNLCVKNKVLQLIFLYTYYFFFIIIIFLMTHITLFLYLFLNFRFIESFHVIKKIIIILLIWKFIGLIRYYFFINWLIVFSFLSFYKRNNNKNENIISLLYTFLINIILGYKKKSFYLIDPFMYDYRVFFNKSKYKSIYFFIFDILSLFLFLFFLYWYFL